MLQGHPLMLLIRELLNKLSISLSLSTSQLFPDFYLSSLTFKLFLKKWSAIISTCLHTAAKTKGYFRGGIVGKKIVPAACLMVRNHDKVVKSGASLESGSSSHYLSHHKQVIQLLEGSTFSSIKWKHFYSLPQKVIKRTKWKNSCRLSRTIPGVEQTNNKWQLRLVLTIKMMVRRLLFWLQFSKVPTEPSE